MGRRAKHLTLQAKQAAKRHQAETYRSSDKGKETKSRANKRDYDKRFRSRSAADSATTPRVSTDILLPDELSTRGHRPLRVSFAHLHIDAGPLLGLWTPPYLFDAPPLGTVPDTDKPVGSDTDEEEEEAMDGSLWRSRAAILGTFQYCEIMEAGVTRAQRWQEEEDVERLRLEVVKEVTERVDAWMALKECRELDGDMETALDWGAKLVYLLVEEWDVRRGPTGVEGYVQAKREGTLPWQRLRRDTMSWMNEEV